MKHLFKLSLLLALLLPATATAHDFEVNGIYYLKNGTNATVTYRGTDFISAAYSGDVIIPSTVTYNGSTYSVTSIGYFSFYCCSRLTSVTIPNSVTSIGNSAFYGCSSLTSVTIPNSVTSIGGGAFKGCSGLTSFIVDSSNAKYDSRNNCNAIIETASNTLIAGCKNTVIPNSVTSIGESAFDGCSGLNSITIPDSITFIGSWAFNGCSNLKDLNFNAESCADFIFGETDELYRPPFYGLDISTVSIGNNVKRIPGLFALGLTKLTGVTIPNSVTSIGGEAFSECYGLDEVYTAIVDPSAISMGYNVFGCYYLADYSGRTLYVPVGTVADYQADTKWSNYFGSIVEMDPVLAESIKLNVTTAGLNEGATLQLTATVLPEECNNKVVLWSSNNPSVATVDSNGLVTTHSVGTATITANTTDGSNLSTACTVTLLPVGVKGDVNGDNKITISDVTSLIDYLLMGHWPEP